MSQNLRVARTMKGFNFVGISIYEAWQLGIYWCTCCAFGLLLPLESCLAEVNVAVGIQYDANGFEFAGVSAPTVDDAGVKALWKLVDGTPDRNSGPLSKLFDGRLPDDADQPRESFFFEPGSDGGRIVVDFGRATTFKEVSTFSWHVGSRAPQVYTLYAANSDAPAFSVAPSRGVSPSDVGWRHVASVDTRSKNKPGEPVGGKYGVTITATTTELANVQYLMFDVRKTDTTDSFGNTFFCEIDAIEAGVPTAKRIGLDLTHLIKFTAADGDYRFAIDAKQAPDLVEWATKELVPVVQKWYPFIVDELPSEGFKPRRDVLFKFRNDMGGVPASAGGGTVNLNASWFRRELEREAKGATVHELVHVVQQYDRASLASRNSVSTPGWIVEGIADYIRWYEYEPQSNGAAISKGNAESATYDASYRVTANFLHWVTETYDRAIVKKLNAAARQGKYDTNIWITSTGKSLEELGAIWKRSLVMPEVQAAR